MRKNGPWIELAVGGIIGLIGGIIGVAAWLFFSYSVAQTSPLDSVEDSSRAADEHAPRIQSGLFGGDRSSDGQTYSVRFIDDNKNRIPTGTDLFAQGTIYSNTWTSSDACSLLLMSGNAYPQHGEVDPSEYCRYSILLTQKRVGGGDMWPAASLVCDVTPTQFLAITKNIGYGNEVRAHGTYAASLDFGVVPFNHFGVPLLKNCTLGDPASDIVRLPSEPSADDYARRAPGPVPQESVREDASPRSDSVPSPPAEPPGRGARHDERWPRIQRVHP